LEFLSFSEIFFEGFWGFFGGDYFLHIFSDFVGFERGHGIIWRRLSEKGAYD